MIIVCEETTQWTAKYAVNHIYFLNKQKNKLYAYINSVSGESKIFTRPLTFSARDRTFDLIASYKL